MTPAYAFISVGFGGPSNEDFNVAWYASGGASTVNLTVPYSGVKDGLSEGYHYATLLANVSSKLTVSDTQGSPNMMLRVGL
jgi:hypothetical protein